MTKNSPRNNAAKISSGMDRKIEKKRWPPKKIAFLALIVAFVGVVAYLLLFQLSKSSLNVEAERVTISTVTRGPFQEYIPVIGEIMPLNTFYLDAAEGGRVEEIFVEAGSMVKKGDKILRLANTSLLLDIMYREAELFQQSNNLRNTRLSMEQQRLLLSKELSEIQNRLQQQKRTYERYQELVKEELISRHEYELAKDEYEYLLERRKLAQESLENDMAFRQAQVESLESSLQRMENNLALAKQKLEDLTIRASVSGHLTTLNAEIGQSKSPGDRLGQIDVLEGFKVRAAIDEYYISRIEIGRTGKFELNNKSYSLVVKKRYPEVKEGRFTLDLEFNGEIPAGITRGQTLHIRLNLSDVSEALLLPRGGFFQTTGGNWVYALDDSGKTAVRRKVRLGRYNSDVYEVLEGLKPGEKVITSSYENFGDNERLILK